MKKKKEKFVEKLMLRQIKQLVKEYYEYFHLGVVVLIDSIEKINVVKIVRNYSDVRWLGGNCWSYYEGAEEDISKTSCN